MAGVRRAAFPPAVGLRKVWPSSIVLIRLKSCLGDILTNRKPIAGDLYQPLYQLDVEVFGNILDNTPSQDADGDRVRLNFVNGQRVKQPADPDGEPTVTIVEGMYGQLTVSSDGSYSYKANPANPVVAGLNPGDLLIEKFSFKVSDGRGATDFAYLDIAIDLPERGDVFVSFDEVGRDFPEGYKGFEWGAIYDGDEALVRQSAEGDAYLLGGVFTTPVRSVDGSDFTLRGFNVADGGSPYANILTVIGYRDDDEVYAHNVLITADTIDAPQFVDLSAYVEKVDRLMFDIEPLNYDGDGSDLPRLQLDDFQFFI
jgi:autoaggregation protein RapA/B/C